MKEEIRKGVTKLADLNYEYVYPHFARTVSAITDTVPGASNLLSPIMVYFEEIIAINTINSLYTIGEQFMNGGTQLASPEDILSVSAKMGLSAAFLFTSVLGNFFRTGIDKKMGVQPARFNAGAEIDFLVDQLNKRRMIKALSFQDTTPLAKQAVDDFTLKHEGVKIDSTNRVQRSFIPRLMLWRTHAIGFFNPFFQEVVFTTDKYPEAIAHEFAHSKGIPQERLAQFVGIASQIESKHQYLQYLGYLSWLNLVTHAALAQDPEFSKKERPEKTKLVNELLTRDGLNERSLEDLRSRWEFADGIDQEIMSYSYLTNLLADKLSNVLPSNFLEKIPTNVAEFCRVPERGIAKFRSDMMMLLTGQKNAQVAYSLEPALLLHDYKEKYVDQMIQNIKSARLARYNPRNKVIDNF